MKELCRTDDRWAGFILRLTLGGAILPYGIQKLVGLFQGAGFFTVMTFFTQRIHLPWLPALLVILVESFGSAAVVVGCVTRLAAFMIASIMVGAVAFVQWQHGFSMKWLGEHQGEGFEYQLLAFGISLALIVTGGGRHSVDLFLTRRFERGERGPSRR
ncbi:MAG TPA: DoxX family protein [Nitrospiria bacterium]|nr:DoxX family protein [Nitrospiria bacterium]